jgi:hypothetical protein
MSPDANIPSFDRIAPSSAALGYLEWGVAKKTSMHLQLEFEKAPLSVRLMGVDLNSKSMRLTGDEVPTEHMIRQRFNLTGAHSNGSIFIASGHWEPDSVAISGEYILPLPDFLDVIQWREYYRVPTPIHYELTWKNAKNEACRARVLNLSLGGFRLYQESTDGAEPPIKDGEKITQCVLTTDSGPVKLDTAKVQYVFPDAYPNGWIIGCAFEREATNALNKLIMSMQVTATRA